MLRGSLSPPPLSPGTRPAGGSSTLPPPASPQPRTSHLQPLDGWSQSLHGIGAGGPLMATGGTAQGMHATAMVRTVPIQPCQLCVPRQCQG